MSFHSQPQKVLLLPIVEDQATMKMAHDYAHLFLNKDSQLRLTYFFPLTGEDMLGVPNRLYRRIKSFRYYGSFYEKRIMRIHNISSDNIQYSNFSLFYWRNRKWKIKSKEELLKLKFGELNVGDLVYDTYLRYKNKATVVIDDPALNDLINYSYQLAKRITRHIQSGKIHSVIIPYTTYIHWGLLTRIAIANDIPVYTFGNVNYLLQEATTNYPFHSKNYSNYRRIFTGLSNQKELLQKAATYLSNRLSGIVDVSISYMRKSAFADTEQSVGFKHQGSGPFAIIFAHCFFDSPHIYGNLLFPDFYEWMKFVLNAASLQPEVTYYVKPHPNGINGNTQIINELFMLFNFPNIVLIDSAISNGQLIKSKPNAIFSVYGTVCHEFAYAGIPSVLAGENPHGKYGFYYNASSIAEMEQFVKNVGQYGLPESYCKSDIEEFFFMNYMYLSKNVYNMEMQKVKDFDTGYCLIPKDASVSEVVFSEPPSIN